jgi:uncharacterized membrane protein YesL
MGLGKLIGIHSPFYRICNMIYRLTILNFLWFFFSLPLITIGASTTALFHVIDKIIDDKSTYLFRDFWKSFKNNFVQSLLISAIIFIFIFILLMNILNINLLGSIAKVFIIVQFIALIELLILVIYVFPILSRYSLKTIEVLKMAFFMANRHLLTTILSLFIPIIIFFLVYLSQFFLFFSISLYSLMSMYIIKKVFNKYELKQLDSQINY